MNIALYRPFFCQRYGNTLLEKYRIIRHADREMSEMILMLEQSWLKTEDQISFLRGIWDTLPERYQVHLHTVLVQFNSKIQQATVLIDGFIGKSDDEPTLKDVIKKKGSVQKLNLALGKKSLVNIINDCKNGRIWWILHGFYLGGFQVL